MDNVKNPNQDPRKVKYVTIAAVFALAGLLLVNYLFLNKETAIKSRATAGALSLSFNPSSISAASGDFTTIIKANGTMLIAGYDFNVSFDKTKMQIKTITYIVGAASAGMGQTTANIAAINSAGTIRIKGEIQSADGYTVSNSNIVTLVFTSTSSASSVIQIPSSTFTKINADFTLQDISAGGASASVNSGGGGTTNTPTPTRTPTPSITPGGPTNTPIPIPSIPTFRIIKFGETLQGELAQTDYNNPYAATGKLDYYKFTLPDLKNYNDIEIFFISCVDDYSRCQAFTSFTERIYVFDSMFRPLLWADGRQITMDTRLDFDSMPITSDKTYIIGVGSDENRPSIYGKYQISFYNSPVISFIPISFIPQRTTINLKLKFQGIASEPKPEFNNMLVKVAIFGPGFGGMGETYNVNFVAGDQGIWKGSLTANKQYGGNVSTYFLIKGPKHIQKKICDTTPTETFPGTYRCNNTNLLGNVLLTDGVNNLDFSGVSLLVGDLPEQDGIVNSYDTSLVRNNFGKTDAQTLKLADLNMDGIVDTQDHSLVISALSYRADEE